MRTAGVLAFSAVITLLVFSSNLELRGSRAVEEYQTAESRAWLVEFMSTLDPTIMRECIARHDAGGAIDLDYLAECGDFALYARYLRVSKYEAVKKFKHELQYAGSLLEFEDRLSVSGG
jgi:hypothetical protein